MAILVVTALMITAGLLGGVANYLGADLIDGPPKSEKRRLIESLVLGLVAALITPLFLSLARSGLLAEIVAKLDAGTVPTSDVAVFFGFCLIAAFSSRIFLGTVSERVLALTKKVKALDAKTEVLSENQDEIAENITPETQPAETLAESLPVAGEQLPPMSPEERAIADALIGRGYEWRATTGVASDAGLNIDLVSSLLAKMQSQGLVESKRARKGHPLFKLTGPGWRAMRGVAPTSAPR